jgi:hypothetical protein
MLHCLNNSSLYLFIINDVVILASHPQEMKRETAENSKFLRVIVIVFVMEQVIFMAYVIMKKGTAIIDYISSLF